MKENTKKNSIVTMFTPETVKDYPVFTLERRFEHKDGSEEGTWLYKGKLRFTVDNAEGGIYVSVGLLDRVIRDCFPNDSRAKNKIPYEFWKKYSVNYLLQSIDKLYFKLDLDELVCDFENVLKGAEQVISDWDSLVFKPSDIELVKKAVKKEFEEYSKLIKEVEKKMQWENLNEEDTDKAKRYLDSSINTRDFLEKMLKELNKTVFDNDWKYKIFNALDDIKSGDYSAADDEYSFLTKLKKLLKKSLSKTETETKTKELGRFIESLASDVEAFMQKYPNAKPRDFLASHPGLSQMSVQTAMYNARKKLGIQATRGKGSYKDDRLGTSTPNPTTTEIMLGKKGWSGTGDIYKKDGWNLYRTKKFRGESEWKLSHEGFGVQTIGDGFLRPNIAKDLADTYIDRFNNPEGSRVKLTREEPKDLEIKAAPMSNEMGYWFEDGGRLINYCEHKDWMSDDPFFTSDREAVDFIISEFNYSEDRAKEVVLHAKKAKCPISF